jgi:glutathione peroxidase
VQPRCKAEANPKKPAASQTPPRLCTASPRPRAGTSLLVIPGIELTEWVGLQILRIMKTATLLTSLFVAMSVIAASKAPVQEIAINDLDGKPTNLGAYAGKTVLLVNVASKCGYTPQYTALESTYRKYKDKGFVVVGVPCNDFGAQEPGSAKEIKEFCTSKFDVTFPMLEKIHVKGPEQHPLYAHLTGKDAAFPGDIKWNFGKFLINPEGKVVARWDSKVTPDSKEITSAIEANLPKK